MKSRYLYLFGAALVLANQATPVLAVADTTPTQTTTTQSTTKSTNGVDAGLTEKTTSKLDSTSSSKSTKASSSSSTDPTDPTNPTDPPETSGKTGLWGSVTWTVDDDTHELHLSAGTGAGNGRADEESPFKEIVENNNITKIVIDGKVVLPEVSFALFKNLPITAVENADLLDFSGVKNASYFLAGSSITDIDTSTWDMSSVTNIDSFFKNTVLTKADVSTWDVSNVTTSNSTFCDSKLAEINIKNWNVGNDTNMEAMFKNSVAADLDTTDWNMKNVTTIAEMFVGSKKNDFGDTIAKWNLASNLSTRSTFEGISVPITGTANWDMSHDLNASSMFRNTINQRTFYVVDWDLSAVTNANNMFAESDATDIDTSKWVFSSLQNADSLFRQTKFAFIDTTNWGMEEVTSASNIFAATICDTTAHNGVYAFNTTNWHMPHVTNMDSMFSGAKVKAIDASNWDTQSATSMSNTFANIGDAELNMKGLITKNVTNMDAMFVHDKMKFLDLSTFDTSSLATNINMFGWTDQLLKIIFPNTFKAVADLPFYTLEGTVWREVGTGTDDKPNGVIIPHDINPDGDWNIWTQLYGVPLDGTYVRATLDFDITINYVDKHTNKTIDSNSFTAANGQTYNVADFMKDNDKFNHYYLVDGQADSITADYHHQTVTVYVDRDYDGTSPYWIENNELHFLAGTLDNQTTRDIFKDHPNITKVVTNEADGPVYLPEDSSYIFSGGHSDSNPNNGYANNLTTIDTTNLSTDKVVNMSDLFARATSLSDVDMSNWNTKNVTNTSETFFDTPQLTDLKIADWDMSNNKNMYKMFSDSGAAIIPTAKWDVHNVENMNATFNWCLNLTEAQVKDWDLSSVTTINSMFNGDAALISLDVSDWNTSNIQDMSYAFNEVTNLPVLDVSHWGTENATNMSHMFYDMAALTELNTSSFKTPKVASMNSMFGKVKKVSALDLSGFDTANNTDFKDIFTGMKALRQIKTSSALVNDGLSSDDNRMVLVNQGQFNKWRAVDSGTANNPTGRFYDATTYNPPVVTSDNKLGDNTWVLANAQQQLEIITKNDLGDKVPDVPVKVVDDDGNVAWEGTSGELGDIMVTVPIIPNGHYTIIQTETVDDYVNASNREVSADSISEMTTLILKSKSYAAQLPRSGGAKRLLVVGVLSAISFISLLGIFKIDRDKKTE